MCVSVSVSGVWCFFSNDASVVWSQLQGIVLAALSTDAASRPETSMPASSSVSAVPGVNVMTPCIPTKPTHGLRFARLPSGRPRVVTGPSSERVETNQIDQERHMSD